jgi:hypothetical protein
MSNKAMFAATHAAASSGGLSPSSLGFSKSRAFGPAETAYLEALGLSGEDIAVLLSELRDGFGSVDPLGK